MRKLAKGTLYKVFVQNREIILDKNYHYIVDGGYLLHKFRWSSRKNFGDLLNAYCKYVTDHFGQNVTVVFDGYKNSCLKDAERKDAISQLFQICYLRKIPQ